MVPVLLLDGISWTLHQVLQGLLAVGAAELAAPASPDFHTESLFDLATGLAMATDSAIVIEDLASICR